MIIIYLMIFAIGYWLGVHVPSNVPDFSMVYLYESVLGSSFGRYALLASIFLLMNKPVHYLNKSAYIFRYPEILSLMKKSICTSFIHVILIVFTYFGGISLSVRTLSIKALIIPVNMVILIMLLCSLLYLCFIFIRNYSIICTVFLLSLGVIDIASSNIFFIYAMLENYRFETLCYLPIWSEHYMICWICILFITVILLIATLYFYEKNDKLRGRYHVEEE